MIPELKIVFAILHTGALTEAKIKEMYPEITYSDAQNYEKIFALMDGQKALLLPSFDDGDDYYYLAIADKSTDREVCYLIEQHTFFGCFVDQREEFDTLYNSGDYSREGYLRIEKECVEVVPEKEWMNLVKADEPRC